MRQVGLFSLCITLLCLGLVMDVQGHQLSPMDLSAATPEMLELINRWAHSPSAPGSTEKYCPLCELAVADLLKTISNHTEDKLILATMEAKCAAKFGKNTTEDKILKELCDVAAGFIVKKLFDWMVGDTHKDWDDVPQIFCSWVHMCRVECCLTPTAPEQIHLSFADPKAGFTSIRVTWTTQNAVDGSAAQWWLADGTSVTTVAAESRTYTDGGWVGMIYSAVMSGLPLNSSFTYRVGSSKLWSSKNFTVRTAPANVGQPGGRPLRIAQVADMGTNEPMGSPSNGTIDHLTELAQSGAVDFIMHVGDISYADGNQHRWDRFMRTMESVAAYVPYMTAPGNHESNFNFASYRTRFWMPEITPYVPIKSTWFWNLGYYDFVVGGASFVMLDVEALWGGMEMTDTQLNWASASLQNAKANRASNATPWIIAAHHRPLYCTNHDRDCGPHFAGKMQTWIEAMLNDNGVDLDISGHMHNYERTYPVFNGTVVGNGSFVAPKAPVYVLNGAGGNEEGQEHPWGDKPWSAYHSSAVGFGLITLGESESAGTASLNYQFITSSNGAVLDQFTITKPWH